MILNLELWSIISIWIILIQNAALLKSRLGFKHILNSHFVSSFLLNSINGCEPRFWVLLWLDFNQAGNRTLVGILSIKSFEVCDVKSSLRLVAHQLVGLLLFYSLQLRQVDGVLLVLQDLLCFLSDYGINADISVCSHIWVNTSCVTHSILIWRPIVRLRSILFPLRNLQNPETIISSYWATISIQISIYVNQSQCISVFYLIRLDFTKFFNFLSIFWFETNFVKFKHLKECFNLNKSLFAYIKIFEKSFNFNHLL